MKWAEHLFTFWLRNIHRSALSKDACPPISLRNVVPLKVGMYRYAREERHEQHTSESAGDPPAHLDTPDKSRDLASRPSPSRAVVLSYQAVAETSKANGYGLRSSTARPVSTSTGTETCVCTTSHLPLIFRKQTVARSQKPVACPVFMVPLIRLRL